MRLKNFFYLLFLLPLTFLAACGNQASAEPAPPIIHYGEDTCDFCGMIISEERFAAGYLTQAGEEHIFDDIGNMFRAHTQWQDEVTAFFVHDYEESTWIRGETAYYVMDEELITPMLHGLVACATQEKAETLAAKVGGQVLTFDEVMAYYQGEAQMGQGHHNHQDHQ